MIGTYCWIPLIRTRIAVILDSIKTISLKLTLQSFTINYFEILPFQNYFSFTLRVHLYSDVVVLC